MKESHACLLLIQDLEGCKLTVYTDANGHPTVGVGHLIQGSSDEVLNEVLGKSLDTGDSITADEAIEILSADVNFTLNYVITDIAETDLTQYQLDALVSLTFNIGIGSLKKSTVLADILAGNLTDAADAFLMWDKPNLLARRHAERLIFNYPVNDIDKFDLDDKTHHRVLQLYTDYVWNIHKEIGSTASS